MRNEVMFDEAMFVNTSVEMLKAMAEDKAIQAASTIDEAYEAFKKYSNATKDEFIRITGIGAKINEEAAQDEIVELTEAQLDIVVGGNIFTDAWNGIKKAASKVAEAASDVWNATPGWAKAAVIGAGIGLLVGSGVGAPAAGIMLLGDATVADAATTFGVGAATGAVVGGLVGTSLEYDGVI